MKSRPGPRRSIAFKTLAVLLGLALAELMARAVLPSLVEPLLQRTSSENAWRLAWVARHQKGVEIYRDGIDAFDPLLGWRNRPHFQNTEPMFGSERVSTNALGARGPREVPHARGTKRRIVVIGDSFAFGWGVSDGATYAARLEQALPDVEVVNLGVGGYGTDQMLLMLESEGLKYRPDLVVAGVVSLDGPRNLVAFRDFAKPFFTLERKQLTLQGTPVPDPASVLAAERWRLKTWDLVQILWTRFDEMRGTRRYRYERITRALLREIQTRARAAGTRVLFLYAPVGQEIFWDRVPRGEKFVHRFAEEEDADLLDLGPEMRERRRRGESFRPGHWGPHAHAVIAEALRERILADGLLDPRVEGP